LAPSPFRRKRTASPTHRTDLGVTNRAAVHEALWLKLYFVGAVRPNRGKMKTARRGWPHDGRRGNCSSDETIGCNALSRSWSSPMTAPPIPSCAAKGFHLLQTICGCASGVLKIADHRARQPLGRDLWRNWESIVLRLKALFVRNHDGNRTLCAAGNAGCFQRNDRCHPSSWCARCPTGVLTVATRGRVFKNGLARFANPLRYKLPPKLEGP